MSVHSMSSQRASVFATLVALVLLVGWPDAVGQNRGAPPVPPGPPGPPPAAKPSAPIDLTGYWVAFVTEDWRLRMVTPPKGDYQNVPLNPEGRRVGDAWDPAADETAGNQCKSYGAAAIMRVPGRLHLTWQDDNTLQVDTDAGTQTRIFHFGPATAAPGQRTWQGYSSAQWERAASGRGGGPAAPVGGSLKVVTTNMRAGYLRKNGVPYSESALLTEYFDVAPLPGGGQALLVTSVVEDSQYLQQPFIVSSQFKKEADSSKWDPTPCTVR
jgi:hypothetical protein